MLSIATVLRRAFLAIVLVAWASPAMALEKTGRVEMEETRPPVVQFSAIVSDFVHNTSFTARPDNTGLVKHRYLGHLELTPHWSPLSLILDSNFFTDKTRDEFRPSEWDQTIGLLYRYQRWAALLRYERDMPIDKSGLVQAYTELQGLYHQDNLLVQKSEFYAALGWLFATQDYFARPDNTGRAALRYVLHGEVPVYDDWLWLIGDTNFFTDRREPNPFAPSELDWIVGAAFRWKGWEVMAFQETDQSIDRSGLTQKYFAIQLKWSWDTQTVPEIHTMRDPGRFSAQGWR
jgi:hypothetical protein